MVWSSTDVYPPQGGASERRVPQDHETNLHYVLPEGQRSPYQPRAPYME
jgi:hypothetical protein